MGNAVQRYFSRLSQSFGQGWNRFWFTPSDPITVCVLRIVAGAAAVAYLISFSFDLTAWFGPHGWLPVDSVQRAMETTPGEGAAYQWSYLNYIESPAVLWAVHLAGIAAAAMFLLGLFTRVTAVLTLIAVLSYIHRAPMLAGQFEPILAAVVFYLCFGPCGRELSLDRRLRARKEAAPPADSRDERFWTATVSLRLVQIHVSGLYLMMGLTKLGAETWWEGSAMWWLMAQSQSRAVDLTFLRNSFLLINAWTHLVVLFELTYGVLIWNRLARPLLLAASVVMWTLTSLVTGLVAFGLLMIAAGAAFVPAEVWRSLLGQSRRGVPNGDSQSQGGTKKKATTAAA